MKSIFIATALLTLTTATAFAGAEVCKEQVAAESISSIAQILKAEEGTDLINMQFSVISVAKNQNKSRGNKEVYVSQVKITKEDTPVKFHTLEIELNDNEGAFCDLVKAGRLED